MHLILVIAFGVFVTVAGAVVHEQGRTAQVTVLRGDVEAVNFLTYRASVAKFFNANPSTTGTVADASLTWATGFVRDARWSNLIAAGTLYVYSTGAIDPGTLQMIHKRTGKHIMVGTKNAAGNLVSLGGVTITAVLPAAIPVGAVVYLGA